MRKNEQSFLAGKAANFKNCYLYKIICTKRFWETIFYFSNFLQKILNPKNYSPIRRNILKYSKCSQLEVSLKKN